MARTGRPKALLVLTDVEFDELERITRRSRTNRNLAFRASLVLACAQGLSNAVVAQRCRTSEKTVGLWRRRFIAKRLEGLYDEPRVGGPRTILDEQVERIVVQTLETTPQGKTHWSTRDMAAKAGVSHATVGKIWRAFGLKPHIMRTFKISDDPQFVEKVRDVVGLYMNPPDHAVVFSFDEKSGIQALQRAQPVLPMDLGQPERQTHNYIRHGTVDLFAALNVKTGEVIAKCKQHHRAKDLVAFFKELDASVERGLEVHVVLDNLSVHKAGLVQRWLLRTPRFKLHFVPTYSSWINLVERFFGLLTEQALKRGSHTSVPQLTRAILDYVEVHNEKSKPFRWTKTADQVLDSVRRFGQRTVRVHG